MASVKDAGLVWISTWPRRLDTETTRSRYPSGAREVGPPTNTSPGLRPRIPGPLAEREKRPSPAIGMSAAESWSAPTLVVGGMIGSSGPRSRPGPDLGLEDPQSPAEASAGIGPMVYASRKQSRISADARREREGGLMRMPPISGWWFACDGPAPGWRTCDDGAP